MTDTEIKAEIEKQVREILTDAVRTRELLSEGITEEIKNVVIQEFHLQAANMTASYAEQRKIASVVELWIRNKNVYGTGLEAEEIHLFKNKLLKLLSLN